MTLRAFLARRLRWLLRGRAPPPQSPAPAPLDETVFTVPTAVKDGVWPRPSAAPPRLPNSNRPAPVRSRSRSCFTAAAAIAPPPARFRYPGSGGLAGRARFRVLVPTRLGYGQSDHGGDFEDSRRLRPQELPRRHPKRPAAGTSAVIEHAPHPALRPCAAASWRWSNRTAASAPSRWRPARSRRRRRRRQFFRRRRRRSRQASRFALRRRATGRRVRRRTRRLRACRPCGCTPPTTSRWASKRAGGWFAAYPPMRGGVGEFLPLPAVGDDGHMLFTKGFAVWRPHADKFLEGVGFAVPKSPNAPPATSFAQLGDVQKVPLKKAEAHASVRALPGARRSARLRDWPAGRFWLCLGRRCDRTRADNLPQERRRSMRAVCS